MAKNDDVSGSAANMVNTFNKHAFSDGHQNNESYKVPMAHITAKTGNSSYMHPHVQPMSPTSPWQSVDKTLQEAERHPEQLSRSKTVFPVDMSKQRGAPKQPKIKSPLTAPGKPRII